jgi:hypothetical protein
LKSASERREWGAQLPTKNVGQLEVHVPSMIGFASNAFST